MREGRPGVAYRARKAALGAETAAAAAAAADAAAAPAMAANAAVVEGDDQSRPPTRSQKQQGGVTIVEVAAKQAVKVAKAAKLRSKGLSAEEIYQVCKLYTSVRNDMPFIIGDVEPRGCCWVFGPLAGLLPLPLFIDSSLISQYDLGNSYTSNTDQVVRQAPQPDESDEEVDRVLMAGEAIMEAIFYVGGQSK